MRQAIGYSIDRDAIVKKLFGDLGVTSAANSLNPFVIADYSNPERVGQVQARPRQGRTR